MSSIQSWAKDTRAGDLEIRKRDEMGCDAVSFAAGAGRLNFLGIPGENLNGVYCAAEFLTRVDLVKTGKRVAVIGDGDTALDAARTAIRLGADKVYLVSSHSFDQMPAREERIRQAKEDGVEFHNLTDPVYILGDSNGWVNEMICQKMALGEPDENGWRCPVPIEDSEFFLQVDTVIVAVGEKPNPILQQTTHDLGVSNKHKTAKNSFAETTIEEEKYGQVQ